MKVTNDSSRVYEAVQRPAQPKAEASAAATAIPTDAVQFSALATAITEPPDNSAKVAALRQALADGRQIVDPGKVADGIIDDALGHS